MAQSWESPTIRRAGEKWLKAYQSGDKRAMAQAARETTRLREKEEGYSLSGGNAKAAPKVLDQTKYSGVKTGGVMGIGAKSAEERYKSYKHTVDTVNENLKPTSARKTEPATETAGVSVNQSKGGTAYRNIGKNFDSLGSAAQTQSKVYSNPPPAPEGVLAQWRAR